MSALVMLPCYGDMLDLVIVLNGTMPFSATSARVAGFSTGAMRAPAYGHAPIAADTAFAAFADVIPVPGLGVVMSIGDLLIVVGVTWLLSRLALAPHISSSHSTRNVSQHQE